MTEHHCVHPWHLQKEVGVSQMHKDDISLKDKLLLISLVALISPPPLICSFTLGYIICYIGRVGGRDEAKNARNTAFVLLGRG